MAVSDKSLESMSEEEQVEATYQALLPSLMEFDSNLTGYTFWREHVIFLETMTRYVDLFNIPHLITAFSPRIFE